MVKKQVHASTGSLLKDIILGGQDGIVNVLGLTLGVAAATNDPRVVLIAGLAGGCAESISMAAVAFTSTQAERDFARTHHKLAADTPGAAALIVGGSSLVGSLLPLIPFLLWSPMLASVIAIIICGVVLFGTGFVKGLLTDGHSWRSGLEFLLIGLLSAFAGYIIGHWLGIVI
ncbi:MAG: VIT1/CCC1 transporter family protein [Nanoarchaeota archaeon]|nr:VIT1/CCC1 transporter family protein [Nanoarchaeota archaeon]